MAPFPFLPWDIGPAKAVRKWGFPRTTTTFICWPSLGQHFANDMAMHVGQPEVAAGEVVGQAFVIQT